MRTVESPEGVAGWGVVALAVLAYALLLDVAVETFLSGSPVRWTAVGFVLAFGALAAAAWRHMTWSTRAAAGGLALLGLLAFTAWRPGGLDDGVRLLGQGTSVVLSVVTAATIAAAGFVMVLPGFLPKAAKLAIGALAGYGVVAFTWGIVRGTPYAELVRGAGTAAPLLHGAVLGTLVVVPAALMLLLAQVAMRMRAPALRLWAVQAAALALVIGTAAAGLRPSNNAFSTPAGGPVAAQDGSVVSARESRLSDKQLDHVIKLLSGALPAMELAHQRLPRETFDVEAVVRRLGTDPATLFRWVRDETFLVPYAGLLRGSTGVLMDRLGNSIDRAVLLHALLRAAGHEARLARGTLTADEAGQLLRNARSQARGAASSPVPTPPQLDQLTPAALDRTATWFVGHARRLATEAGQRARAQSSTVVRAVERYRTPDTDAEATAVAALRDHWWVEWSSAAGWVALDPSLPSSEPGQALRQADQTIDPGSLSDMPADALHAVGIRVVLETWRKGRLSESTALEHELLPAELIGQRIVLRTVPLETSAVPDTVEPRQAYSEFERVLRDQREWLPVLEIGDRRVQRLSFDAAGNLREPASGMASEIAGGVEALGSGLGQMLSGRVQRSREPASEAQATALWVEYIIRSPSRPTRTLRREIFDLIGPHSRAAPPVLTPEMTEAHRLERALALAAETQILPQVSHWSRDFVQHLALSTLLSKRGTLLELLAGSASGSPRDIAQRLSELGPLSSHLYTLALVRSEWSEVREAVYLDRPNVLTYREGLRRGQSTGLVGYRGFDIVENGVAVHRGAAGDPFEIRVAQGVLDSNAESLLLRRFGPTQSTAEHFAAAQSDGGESWSALRGAHSRPPSGTRLPSEAWALIERDLQEGSVALVPLQPVAVDGRSFVGWWRIDPRTGTTLGIGDRGWGQAASEFTLQLRDMVKIVAAMTALVKVYDCMIRTTGSSDGEGVPFDWAVPCIFGLICELMSLGPNYLDGPDARINAFQLICNCAASGLEGSNENCLPEAQSGPTIALGSVRGLARAPD